MNRITSVTKNAILDLFKNGVDMGTFESEFKTYPYYGRLSEIEFLKRLYILDKMPPGNGSQFKTLEDDIWQHTENNDDYDPNWIFTDDRFPLKKGSDEDYLKFLCEIFHPEAFIDSDVSQKYLKEINSLLRKDRYELYPINEISGRNVYSWRDISEKEVNADSFLPFSQRMEKEIKVKSIPKKIRRKLLDVMNKNEQMEELTTDTGLNYNMLTKKVVMSQLSAFYATKYFDENKSYRPTNNLEQFVMDNYPKCVLDVIEIYCQVESSKTIVSEFNSILETLGYKLLGGKIEASQSQLKIVEPSNDNDLKSLIQDAMTYHKKNTEDDSQRALEKIWDAFERLKTYYGTEKKQSLQRIEDFISQGNENVKSLIDKEFDNLTNIGNDFEIRHFERGKINIQSKDLKDYLFDRCSILINFVLKSIEGRKA